MSFFNGEIDLAAGNVYNNTLEVDTVNEATGGAGVTIDGVLLRDSYVQLQDIAAPSNAANGQGRLYKLTGNAGLWWLPDSAGSPINLATVGTSVSRTGSTADNTISRWDGNNTDTIQGSGIIIDDSNNMTGIASIGLESGAFDTTLTVSTQTVGAPTINIPDLAGTSGEMLISNAMQNILNKTVTSSTWSGGNVTGLTSFSINDNGSNDLVIDSSSSLTADRTLTVNVNDADRTIDLAGNLSLSAGLTTSGGNSLTFTTTGPTSITLPTSGTLLAGPVDLATQVTGTLAIGNGGTGTASIPTNGQLLIGNGTGYTLATISSTANQTTVTNGAGTITIGTVQNIGTSSSPSFASETLSATSNQLVLGTTNTTTINSVAPAASRVYTIQDAGAAANIVTLTSPYVVGDLPYASSTTQMSRLADVATGNSLISGGVGVAPSWGKIGLTTHVSGTLPAANGGTGQSTYVVGDILSANTTTTLTRIADIATGNALISGGVGVLPTWGKIGLTTHVTGVLPQANGGTGGTTAVTSVTGTANQITATPTTGAVVVSTPTTFIAPGTLQDTTGLIYSSNASVAAAGTTAGTATVLTTSLSFIISATAGSAQGVALNSILRGYIATIFNNTDVPVFIYPATTANGSQFLGLGINAAYPLPPRTVITVQNTATTPSTWGIMSYNFTYANRNVLLGTATLSQATTGTNNIAIGHNAMSTGIVTSTENISIGTSAGSAITSSANNVYIGTNVGRNTTVGGPDTAIGSGSLSSLSYTGGSNTMIGRNTGAALQTTSSTNTFIGNTAGASATSSSSNIAIGNNAMGNATAPGGSNIIIGNNGLGATFTGATNILIGPSAGSSLTTGSNNIVLGTLTPAATTSGSFRIGNAAGDLITANITTASQHWSPSVNNQTDLGTSAIRWRSLWLSPLQATAASIASYDYNFTQVVAYTPSAGTGKTLSLTWRVTRVGRLISVMIANATTNAVANSLVFASFNSSTNLGTTFLPIANIRFPVRVIDSGGTATWGYMTVTTTGGTSLFRDELNTNWTTTAAAFTINDACASWSG